MAISHSLIRYLGRHRSSVDQYLIPTLRCAPPLPAKGPVFSSPNYTPLYLGQASHLQLFRVIDSSGLPPQQTGDMGGVGFNIDRQGSGFPIPAGPAPAGLSWPFSSRVLSSAVMAVFNGLSRLFCSSRLPFPYCANPPINGGQALAGLFSLYYKIAYPGRALGGLSGCPCFVLGWA